MSDPLSTGKHPNGHEQSVELDHLADEHVLSDGELPQPHSANTPASERDRAPHAHDGGGHTGHPLHHHLSV